jgi:hypothetical protein
MAKDTDDKVSWIRDKVEEVADTCHNIDKEVALQKAAFDDHLIQDERMFQEFKRMNDILQQNTNSLKEHMHRTDMLESLAMKIDARLAPIEIDRIKKAAVSAWCKSAGTVAAKVITLFLGSGGIIWAVMQVLSHIHW